MQAFIVSDHETTSRWVRNDILRSGYECPIGNVLPLDWAATQLAGKQDALVVVVLAPDPERALTVVKDLHAASTGSILVVGPAADPRLVLRSLRSGASDFVDEADLDGELTAALARFRKGAGKQGESARIIAVLGPSGGSGSSTLAVNVATTLASKEKPALLVDLKLQNGDLAALLDLKPAHTLAELCQNADRLDRTMFEGSLARHESGVHLLAPPRWFADIGYVTPDGVRQMLNLARTLFPYVVIDMDHSFAPEQIQALRQVDHIILVLRLDFTSMRNAQRTLEYLDQLGVGRDKVRVVVNRYGQAKEIPADRAAEALGVKIEHYIPDDPRTVNRANNNGVPVVIESPTARVSKAITTLAASVNGKKRS